MGRNIRLGYERFELISRREGDAAAHGLHFLDRDDAMRLLRRLASDPVDLQTLRTWAHEEEIFHRDDRALLTALAGGLMSGTLRIARLMMSAPNVKGGGTAPPAPGPTPPGPGPAPPGPGPRPAPRPNVKTFLKVTVKDSDGKPVEAATVKAGAAGNRKTDAHGLADFGEVEPGTYDITSEKPGHSPRRNDPIGKDDKKAVAVPAGKTTHVDLVQHPGCANVAFFEGSTTRSKYFGFDHKTNIKAVANGEYWLPTPDKGTLSVPGSKFTRDEARWVSVAVGKETEAEINFAFKPNECIPCISNSTFTVVPATVAEVVTKRITAKKAIFKIKGKAKGEATLKVICDGKDIGWFHIWCESEVTLKLDVAVMLTDRTSAVGLSLNAMSDHLNDVFRQAAIKLDLKNLGTVDMRGNLPFSTFENMEYPDPSGVMQKGTTEATDTAALTLMDGMALAVLNARAAEPRPRAGARRLYWYVPTAGAQWGGQVVTIGHPATFVFFADSAAARNTCAHEIGHSLNLRHPSDGSSAAQFAAHNRATRNSATPAYATTNTERASAANPAHGNIMANDPTNLMGYWPDKAARKYLRYHQWIAVSRS